MDNTNPMFYLGSSAGEPSCNNISTTNNIFVNDSNGFPGGETFRGSASLQVRDHVNNVISNGGGINFTGTNHQVNVDAEQKSKGKKQRFAFQTRSQVDILDDGYRWRKYGQKTVKNNTYPRNYFKCTHQGCNVKKQVQRLDEDETVVVTTYEGVHTHSIVKPSDSFQHILRVEVKARKPLHVAPDNGDLIHISQVSLGEVKNPKSANSILVRMEVDGKELCG